MGDPLPGLTAQDFADGLDDSLSDHDLAEAIALISNKVGHLMHLVEEGEASGDELDEWLVLENKLCQEALERGGSISGEGPGLMGMIAPFMERNGYRDAHGWWVCDEGGACQGVADCICPECGACCSTQNFANRLANLRFTGGVISPWLENFVNSDLGHWEKKEFYCYKCGKKLVNGKCPDCGITY